MANAQFSVSSIDPDTLKISLINWLSNQPQFSGYNFSGANFNAILDLLTRNTSLNAFYTNMGFNETFLDSATLRDSVVSRAKEMNYCPSSFGSSFTSADITINTNGLTQFNIPFGTRFGGTNSNGNYTFVTNDNYFQTSFSGNYEFANVMLYEGNYLSEVFTINNNIPNQRFTFSNPTIDTTSLMVLVSEDGGVTLNPYKLATNIYNINGNSCVYFLQAAPNNMYEIYFGDGVLGHQANNGSIVQVYYRACSGSAADNCTSYTLLDNLGTLNGGVVTQTVIQASPSNGSSDPEDIESIRFRAPRNIQAQERAATGGDYETLILKNFPEVGDVHAYRGGVTPTAVQYGTVLLSCVTPAGNPLTQTLKNSIVSYCTNLDLIHPSTQVIDAATLLIDVSSNVHVDFSVTNNSISYYQTNAANAVLNFGSANLQKFNKVLRYSKLSDAIDSVDNNAILSNELTLVLKRQIPVMLNTATTFVASFSNPVTNFSSDQFISNGVSTYITDTVNNSSNGTLYNVFLNSTNNVIRYTPIGSINYATGSVAISNLSINQFLSNNTSFFIYANPQNRDIYSANNDILKIDPQSINISVANN